MRREHSVDNYVQGDAEKRMQNTNDVSSWHGLFPKKEGGKRQGSGFHPPRPTPNGGGKGRIKIYYYSRTQILFWPTQNCRQTNPIAREASQHHF